MKSRNVPRSLSLAFIACFASLFACASESRGEGAWTKVDTGALVWLRAISFVDARRGFVAGGRGLLLSTEDGGATWRTLRRPCDDTVRDIAFTDANAGLILCERSAFQGADSEPRAYLLRTTDGGKQWTRVSVAEERENLVRVIFSDATRGWAFGELGAIYSTNDGGASWKRLNAPTHYLLTGGAFCKSQTKVWFVGANATALFTEDDGATWRAGRVVTKDADENASGNRAHLPRLNAVSFVDAKRGWAVGARGAIFITNDGGRAWYAQEPNVTVDLNDVAFLDAREGWAVGAEGALLHTTNGGVTWDAEESGTEHTLERICFVGEGALRRGFIVGFGGTLLAYNAAGVAPNLK